MQIFSKQSDKKILIVEPLTCEKIFYKKVKRLLKGENLLLFDYFTGFYCKNGNHWILFFGDFKKRHLYVLDPLEDEENTSQICLENWNCFIQERKEFKCLEDSENEWKIGSFQKTKQTDSHNCGIIVLLLLENLKKSNFSFMFYFNFCDQSWKEKDNYWGLFFEGNKNKIGNLKYNFNLMAEVSVIDSSTTLSI